MAEKRVLVIGASGYVGTRLVPFLLNKGFKVRATGRSEATLKKRPWADHSAVELLPLDILNPGYLEKACVGCEAAYYLVHSMNPAQKDFADADRHAAQNMVKAAENSGLKRIIYLGGLGEESPALSKHLRSRAEVSRILHSGKVPVTTLRAAVILGVGSVSFEILCYLVRRLPIMITPRWVRTQSQPIAIRNALVYLADCLDHEETMGEIYDIGGPDIVSYQELMRIFAEEAGLKKRLVIPVLVLTPRLSSYWIHLVTPINSSLARPLAEGLKNKVICLDDRIKRIIPQNLITARQAIRLVLKSEELPPLFRNLDNSQFPSPEQRYPGDPDWAGAGKPAKGK